MWYNIYPYAYSYKNNKGWRIKILRIHIKKFDKEQQNKPKEYSLTEGNEGKWSCRET